METRVSTLRDPGLGSGVDRVRAREEGGRPAGGGAWPRCAALTRWHSDRWRKPAAAAQR